MSQANTKPVSARVLDAAIAWQLCLDCGNGSEVEQAEFAKWYAASEEHARAWLQLGMLDHRFSAAFLYSRLDGLTHADIAERLGVSVPRVRQYLAQGIRQCYIALYGEPT